MSCWRFSKELGIPVSELAVFYLTVIKLNAQGGVGSISAAKFLSPV